MMVGTTRAVKQLTLTAVMLDAENRAVLEITSRSSGYIHCWCGWMIHKSGKHTCIHLKHKKRRLMSCKTSISNPK